ncbi:hypothetical protein I4U23_005387 [Adineta vaga]|nr:hypothetical protein I4U23_005387 [Adineta vaga]
MTRAVDLDLTTQELKQQNINGQSNHANVQIHKDPGGLGIDLNATLAASSSNNITINIRQ